MKVRPLPHYHSRLYKGHVAETTVDEYSNRSAPLPDKRDDPEHDVLLEYRRSIDLLWYCQLREWLSSGCPYLPKQRDTRVVIGF